MIPPDVLLVHSRYLLSKNHLLSDSLLLFKSLQTVRGFFSPPFWSSGTVFLQIFEHFSSNLLTVEHCGGPFANVQNFDWNSRPPQPSSKETALIFHRQSSDRAVESLDYLVFRCRAEKSLGRRADLRMCCQKSDSRLSLWPRALDTFKMRCVLEFLFGCCPPPIGCPGAFPPRR